MGLSPRQTLGKEEDALRGEGSVSLKVLPSVEWTGSRLPFVEVCAGFLPQPSGNSSDPSR